MNTRIFLMAVALALLGGLWQTPVYAQCGTAGPVCMTRTTLNGNIDNSQTTITVTSATGFTVDNKIWVDFEQMHIVSITGTRISVRRGDNGTAAQAHDDLDAVWTGAPAHFHTNDPDTGQDCTRGSGQAANSPWINVRTGWVFVCDDGVTADWTATLKAPRTLNSDITSF